MPALEWQGVNLLAGGLMLGLAGWAGWSDFRVRRIPNSLCLILFGCGLVVVGQGGGGVQDGWAGAASAGLHAGIALAAGFGLFSLGIIGGGDAKFYAALAAWFPLQRGFELLLLTSLAGLGLFLAWFVIRRIQRKPIVRKATDPMDKLPYGLAIGLGAIWAFVT